MGFLIIFFALAALIFLYFNSPAVKGRISEQAVSRKLKADSFLKHDGKCLTNLYVPRASGSTSEIDILYITRKGLFVLENKNYAGYIFGSESSKNWTVTLYAGKNWLGGNKVEKHQFYNPVWQNRAHINSLKAYLNSDIHTFSLITFSDRGSLKHVTIDSQDTFVCNHRSLLRVISAIWKQIPDILTDEQVDALYDKLLPLTNASKETKQKHISNIQNNLSNTSICPLCGGQLVLRTASRGAYAGKRFYGCSNYPKCKYTKNI